MSKKNMKQDSKNTMSGVNNRGARISAKRREQEAAEKKRILIGGVIGITLAVILSVVLIWHYTEPVLARVDGTRLRAEDLNRTRSMGEQRFWSQANADFEHWERGVREEAVRAAALVSLYEDFGRQMGLTFTGTETPEFIVQSVTNAIRNDPDVFADFEAYMPADTRDESTAKATDILERVRAGEDFHTLMHVYSEDVHGLQGHPDGYTFLEGQMVSAFCEATRALEIGEISDLVPTEFGYHIIKRIEPDPYNRFPGAEDAPEEDLLGAMHILISFGPSLVERMDTAIELVFGAKLEDVNIVFLPALYDEW